LKGDFTDLLKKITLIFWMRPIIGVILSHLWNPLYGAAGAGGGAGNACLGGAQPVAIMAHIAVSNTMPISFFFIVVVILQFIIPHPRYLF